MSSTIIVSCMFDTFFELTVGYFVFGWCLLTSSSCLKETGCLHCSLIHDSVKNVHMDGRLHRRRDRRLLYQPSLMLVVQAIPSIADLRLFHDAGRNSAGVQLWP